MPSTSPKQHRFMEAIAHDPAFAAKAGVKQSVGKDFAKADGDTSLDGQSPQGASSQEAAYYGGAAPGAYDGSVTGCAPSADGMGCNCGTIGNQ